ncbi:MAG TPA: hypothetical protein V6C69_16135 [Trichormus sp.]|jgi:hypothetical protein
MNLKQKADDWKDLLLKAIIFFAVLGSITLIIAVYMVGKSLSDITDTLNQPATQTTTGTTSPDRH